MKVRLHVQAHGHRWITDVSPFTAPKMAALSFNILSDSIRLKLPTPVPVIASTAQMIRDLVPVLNMNAASQLIQANLYHLCNKERELEDKQHGPLWQASASATLFLRTPVCECVLCSAIRGYKLEIFKSLVSHGVEHGMEENMNGYLNVVQCEGCLVNSMSDMDWNVVVDDVLHDKALMEDLRLTNEEVKKAVKHQNEKGE